MSRIDDLEQFVKQAFASGEQRAYVETGRYKGFMPSTVQALVPRGYRVERVPGPRAGAFYVYAK